MTAGSFVFMPKRMDSGLLPRWRVRWILVCHAGRDFQCLFWSMSVGLSRTSAIPRERHTKISRRRNSLLVGGAINLRHENDGVSKSVPATHAHGLFHNLADRH